MSDKRKLLIFDLANHDGRNNINFFHTVKLASKESCLEMSQAELRIESIIRFRMSSNFGSTFGMSVGSYSVPNGRTTPWGEPMKDLFFSSQTFSRYDFSNNISPNWNDLYTRHVFSDPFKIDPRSCEEKNGLEVSLYTEATGSFALYDIQHIIFQDL
jgi:hypothetical protein